MIFKKLYYSLIFLILSLQLVALSYDQRKSWQLLNVQLPFVIGSCFATEG